MKIQIKIENKAVSFASPFLPKGVIQVDDCKDIEAAKEAILLHVERKTGTQCFFEEVEEIGDFIHGIHI